MIQGFYEEGEWIRFQFKSQWTQTPIAWDNLEYAPKKDTAYVRFSIQHTAATVASIGADSMRRHDGMVVLEVFVPEGTQTGTMEQLCDAAAEIFRNAKTSGIRFFEPQVVRVGASGSWYKRDVLCPFQRDTVFT